MITDRKVCVPTGIAAVVSLGTNGTTSDTTVLTFKGLQQKDYRMTFAIVNEGETCPADTSFVML